MKNPSEILRRYKALFSVSLVAALGAILALSVARVNSQSPVNIEVAARNLVAAQRGLAVGEVEVAHSSKMEFKKRAVTAFKLMDNRSGEIYEVALDERGREVDVEKLLAEERAERETRFGKLDPALAERLANNSADEPVEVIIWLKQPSTTEDDRSLPFEVEQLRSDDGQKQFARAQAQLYSDQIDLRRAATVERAVAPAIARLTERGHYATTDRYAPVIYASLKPEAIREVARWEEVDQVYLSTIHEPQLDTVRVTIRTPLVHWLNIKGQGVKVAQVEAKGGRVAANNPYLPSFVQDTTFVCDSPEESDGHATAVAGVMLSNRPGFGGISPLATLWAGGDCAGVSSRLMDRANDAADWGARAINLSFGKNFGLVTNGDDRFYDNLVFNRRRTVVVGAGNRGAADCYQGTDGNVTSPGLGYNVITVGSYSDIDTADQGDDVMAPCSSWRDPISQYNDREKPEVAAPGGFVSTTSPSSPWFYERGGTSLAAPMVTGVAALLMQRNWYLTLLPEAVKAILMATATHNIEGSARLSEKDGAGGIQAFQADSVAQGMATRWGGVTYNCASKPVNYDLVEMSLTAGKRTRAAIVWGNDPDYALYADRPGADLDLQVINPNGSSGAFSISYDNAYEIVDFTPSVSGVYKLRVRKGRCEADPKYLAFAWYQGN
jgi:hypothetical protein